MDYSEDTLVPQATEAPASAQAGSPTIRLSKTKSVQPVRRVVYVTPPSQFKFTDRTRFLLVQDRFGNPFYAVPRFTPPQLAFGMCLGPSFALLGLVVQACAVTLMIAATIQNGCVAYDGPKPRWGGQAWDVTSARIVMWFIVLLQVRSDFEDGERRCGWFDVTGAHAS